MNDLLSTLKTKKNSIGIIAVFLVFAAFIIATTHYGTKTLSALRAYVAGEGQWTKAQKQITQQLLQYSINQQPEHYVRAQDQLGLHQGFQKARKALIATPPDQVLAAKGFRTAGIHPRDIHLLIWLSLTFRKVDRLEEAFAIWKQAEEHITKLDSLWQQLHRTIRQNQLDQETRSRFVAEISSLDQTLTELETSFSTTMGALARRVRGLIFWLVAGTGTLLLVAGYLVTRRFFREIKDLNHQLSEQEAQFRTVLEHARDVIYELDIGSGTFKYVSPHIEQQLGYPIDQIVDGGQHFIFNHIHPDDRPRVQQDLKELIDQGNHHASREVDFRIMTKEGNYIWVNAQRSLIHNKQEEPISIVGTVRDISERKEHELQTQQSLQRKRILLEEIHHRVKNNLSSISSILELQKHESSESVKDIIEETQSRIQSIATIHKKLYQTETLSEIDIQEYISDFSEIVFNTFSSSQTKVSITKDLRSFSLNASKVVPVGLIVNELLSNALQHGFPDEDKGEINITINKKGEEAILSVADNGNPLPGNFSLDSSGSLGMTLIKTLVKQLEGELNITQDEWTTFEIKFPVAESDNQN